MIKLSNLARNWSVPVSPEEVLAAADVVIAHEFGDQKTPSKTTEEIVNIGVAHCKKYTIPLVCQFPGNVTAEKIGMKPLYVVDKHLLKPGKYLDTEEVNRQVAMVCARHGWKSAIVCTHPHHLWRAGNNLRLHGIIPAYPDVSGIHYDEHCARKELSSARRFMPREIKARAWYWLLGQINLHTQPQTKKE